MTRLAGFSGKEIIKRFQKLGYVAVRQRGSHVRLIHPDPTRRRLTIPLHREIGIGLLSQLIKDAGIDQETFLNL